MTDITATRPRFDMSRVVKRMFGAIGRNWVVFFGLAVLLTGIPQALFQFFMFQAGVKTVGGSVPLSGASPGVILTAIPAGLLMAAASAVLQAALVHGTVADLNGRKASFGDCLSTGLKFLLPAIGLAILEAIALVFGFVLFIVPCVMMALAWSVAMPALVVERTGVFGAFGRSAELTRRHRWSILGLACLYFLVSLIVGAVIGGVIGGVIGAAPGVSSPDRLVLLQIVVSLLLQPVQILLVTAGIASVYYELRSIKEGIGPEALASVFD